MAYDNDKNRTQQNPNQQPGKGRQDQQRPQQPGQKEQDKDKGGKDW